jgi:hypothetical protein
MVEDSLNHLGESPAPLQPTFARDGKSPISIPHSASHRVPFNSTCEYITIHQVECSRVGHYHSNHESSADYFDVPFLPVHSNRTTGLRGQHRLASLDHYIEDHINLSFVVLLAYNCEEYHETIKSSFERLPMPQMDISLEYQARPYFYVLQNNARPAKPRSERLILSESLQKALQVLRSEQENASSKEEREEDKFASNLIYPYLELYHQRKAIFEGATKEAPIVNQIHFTILSGYLKERLGSEYTEAEELFARGAVNRKHWAKLFRPGVLVVNYKSNELTAYVSTSCTIVFNGTLQLSCWSWAFESKFFKNEVDLVVSWPSNKDTIAITDLLTYPLEYAPAGLEQELRHRGQAFWACRSRKFVNYDVPLQGMEVQKVGS